MKIPQEDRRHIADLLEGALRTLSGKHQRYIISGDKWTPEDQGRVAAYEGLLKQLDEARQKAEDKR